MGNSQLWIFLLFMSLSAISWLITKLKEQARIKAAKDAARRRYEEELRTGRSGEPQRPERDPAETERQRAAMELAARRQEQLKELRRQQAAQARPRSQTVGSPTPPGGGGAGRPANQQQQKKQRQQQRPQQEPRPLEEQSRARDRKGIAGSAETREAFDRKREIEQREREQASQLAAAAAAQRAAAQRTIQAAAIERSEVASVRRKQAPIAAFGRALLQGGPGADHRQQMLRLMAISEILAKPVSER